MLDLQLGWLVAETGALKKNKREKWRERERERKREREREIGSW